MSADCGMSAASAADSVQQRFALNIIIAFIPAAVLGVLFSKLIKTYLFGPVPVAIALVVGGLIIFLVEKRQENIKPRITDIDSLTAVDALKLGLAQAFALIPGTCLLYTSPSPRD